MQIAFRRGATTNNFLSTISDDARVVLRHDGDIFHACTATCHNGTFRASKPISNSYHQARLIESPDAIKRVMELWRHRALKKGQLGKVTQTEAFFFRPDLKSAITTQSPRTNKKHDEGLMQSRPSQKHICQLSARLQFRRTTRHCCI